MNEYY